MFLGFFVLAGLPNSARSSTDCYVKVVSGSRDPISLARGTRALPNSMLLTQNLPRLRPSLPRILLSSDTF